MKKLWNALVILLGCAILAVPIVMAASAPGSSLFSVTTYNATITKAVANIGGVANAGSQISATEWQFDLGGAPDGLPVSVRVLGVAAGSNVPMVEVSGDVDATGGVCRDKSNRQRTIVAVSGGDPEDCYCDGMTPSTGDKLVIRVTGTVVNGGSVPPDAA